MGAGPARDFVALTASPYASDADARAVVDAFTDGTLPRAAWNHRAHLTVGLWHRRRADAATALDRTRSGILRFNAGAGIVSTPTSGYHETLTRLYMHVIGLHAQAFPAADLAADANALVDVWGDRDLPLRYWTKERLFSVEARAAWLEPDLQPLP